MAKNIISLAMVTGATFVLLGCGGGGSSDPVVAPTAETVTGQFIDTYVEGLKYTCSSGTTGVTNSNGEYTCNVGDSVEFSLGSYIIGSTTASSGVVSPQTLYPNNPEAALDVAQLLQTLDDDNDPSNGIAIPDGYADLDAVTVRPGDGNFDAGIEAEIGEPLVAEERAQAHMEETQLRLLFTGKTFYTTIWDDIGTMESWAFNADLTSVTWTELVGGSATGTGSLVIDGMTMTFTCTSDSEQACETDPTIIEVKEIVTDYIVVEVRGGELGTEIETLRLYFDEEKAKAYLLGATPPPASSGSIVGSWYLSDTDGQVTVTFFSDGSYVLAEEGVADTDGQSGMERGTYNLDTSAGTLTVTTQVDTNGEWGLSNPEGGAFGIEVTNNQLTFIEGTDRYVATRVEHVENTIVGSWYYRGDVSEPNKLVVITFLSDGTYMMLEDSIDDLYGQDGIEVGTYTWNAGTSAFNCIINIDTNGEWGLSDVGTGITVTVQNGTLTFTIPNEGSMDFTKVPY